MLICYEMDNQQTCFGTRKDAEKLKTWKNLLLKTENQTDIRKNGRCDGNVLFFGKKTEMNRINVLSGMLCAVDALKSTWGNISQ